MYVSLAHLVQAPALGRPRRVLALELVVDGDVEIALVLLVGAVVERALHLLTLLDGEDVLEVEDGLLPVGVLGVGAGREADGRVAVGEFNVEPGDKGVDVVIAPGDELEVGPESQIGGGALFKVEGQDVDGVSDDSLDVDSIDKGLGEGSLLKRAVVEAVDVVPDWKNGVSNRFSQVSNRRETRTANLLILVVTVLDAGNEDGSLVGEDETVVNEVTVTGVEDGVQHGLVEKEVAHPLGDNDIDLGEGELDLLHLALDQGDLVGEAVDLDDLAGLEDDGGHVNTNNVLSASLGGKPVRKKSMVSRLFWHAAFAHSASARAAGPHAAGDRGNVHGKDTGTAADIENDLVLEHVTVPDDSVHVRPGANLVLQHLLVDAFAQSLG